MYFVFYTDSDFSQRKTNVYELELLTIETGKLKGEKYFKPIQEKMTRIKYAHFPENFLQNEFLELDATNERDLLDFQCEYGQIAMPSFIDIDKGKSNIVFSYSKSGNESKLRYNGETDTTTAAIQDYLRKRKNNIVKVVSLKEVQDTVDDLQNYIRATTNAKQGSNSLWDAELSRDFVELANYLKRKYYPAYGVFEDKQDPNAKNICMPLIPNLIFMQMESLTNDKPYYKCEVCGKLKQYQRRQPKPGERHYCSESCRQLAKSRRQNQRRRESANK